MNQYVRLRPVLILLLAAMVCVLGLAWVMDARGAESASPAPSAAVAAGAAASPAAGKVIYKVGWTRQPDNLNPFIGFESPAFEMWYLTYDSLVGYDPATLSPMKGENSTGPRHRLVGQRRTASPGRSPSARTRSGSDGVPLTAKDVAFTYNYIVKNPEQTSNLTAYTNLIKEATALDDYTVQFVCSKPKPDMTRHWVPILPEHIWSKIAREGSREEVQEQPALRGLRPVHSAWSGRRTTTSTSSPTPPGGARSPRSTRSTSRTTPTATPCCRTSRPAPSTVPRAWSRRRSSSSRASPASPPAPSPPTRSTSWPSTATRGPARATRCCRDVKFRQAMNYAVDQQKIVDLVMMGYTDRRHDDHPAELLP